MKNANIGSEKIVKVRRMAGVPVRSGVKAGGRLGDDEFGSKRGPKLGDDKFGTHRHDIN